jgi:hypothetical protein
LPAASQVYFLVFFVWNHLGIVDFTQALGFAAIEAGKESAHHYLFSFFSVLLSLNKTTTLSQLKILFLKLLLVGLFLVRWILTHYLRITKNI